MIIKYKLPGLDGAEWTIDSDVVPHEGEAIYLPNTCHFATARVRHVYHHPFEHPPYVEVVMRP